MKFRRARPHEKEFKYEVLCERPNLCGHSKNKILHKISLDKQNLPAKGMYSVDHKNNSTVHHTDWTKNLTESNEYTKDHKR